MRVSLERDVSSRCSDAMFPAAAPSFVASPAFKRASLDPCCFVVINGGNLAVSTEEKEGGREGGLGNGMGKRRLGPNLNRIKMVRTANQKIKDETVGLSPSTLDAVDSLCLSLLLLSQ